MLNKLITSEVIGVKEHCNTWQEAINKGADLLLKRGDITENYEKAILNNFEEMGPYMVIAPRIVLSHARPEDGVNRTAMSLITLDTPVKFGSDINDPVSLVITLAAKDNSGHLEALTNLMDLFMNSDDLEKVFKAKTKEDVVDIIKKYGK